MKAWTHLIAVLAFGIASHAQATCTRPDPPAPPPDGKTATMDQMLTAKHDFDRYNGEMNTYLDCVTLEMDSAPKDTSAMSPDEKKAHDQQQKALVAKHDAAVDELKSVVGKFNEQLRIFKAKQAKK